MDLNTWTKIALVCLLGAISPGPSLLLVIRSTLNGGRRQGFSFAIGHGFAIGIYAFIAVTGIGLLVLNIPEALQIINWCGIVFLLYIGLQTIRSPHNINSNNSNDTSLHWKRAIVEGFLAAFLNPKITIFFIAVFSQFISDDFSWRERVIITITASGIDCVWYLFVAFVLSGPVFMTWLHRYKNLVNIVGGSLLILAAFGLTINITSDWS